MPQVQSNESGCATPPARWTPFLDGVAFLFGPEMGSPGSRARILKRAAAAAGICVSSVFTAAEGLRSPLDNESRAGIRFSLGAVWNSPEKLAELLNLASSLGATVGELELAQDALGQDAQGVAEQCFPSLLDPAQNSRRDSWTLKQRAGWFTPWPDPLRWNTAPDRGASYLKHKAAPVNCCAYLDRPSKLDPEGPNVFHIEVRAKGNRVPAKFREPLALLKLRDAATFDQLLECFIIRRSLNTDTRPDGPGKWGETTLDRVRGFLSETSQQGSVCMGVAQMAAMVKRSERSVFRALAAMREAGELEPERQPVGRGKVASRAVSAVPQIPGSIGNTPTIHQNTHVSSRAKRRKVLR